MCMVTVPIWSKLLVSRPPCAFHMEEAWSLLIKETTVSMWQLAYTHLLTYLKRHVCLKYYFYHLAFAIVILTLMVLFFPVCHAHGGNSLNQVCCIVYVGMCV